MARHTLKRALVTAAFASAAQAQASECVSLPCAEEPGNPQAKPFLAGSSARLSLRAGNAVSPFHQERFAEVQSELGEMRIVTLSADVAITPDTSILLAVPWVAAGVLQPAGSHLRTTVLGNATLGARHAQPLASDGAWQQTIEWFVGAGIPLSDVSFRGPALEARALALAAALENWTTREAYAPGALSLVTAATARSHHDEWLELSAALKAPLLFRVRTAGESPEDETRALGFLPSMELAGRARVWSWLSASLASSLAVDLLPLTPPAQSSASVQLAMIPGATVHLHPSWSLDVDVNTAVAGPLWGTFGLGVALRAEL